MNIQDINKFCENTMISHLGIEFLDFSDGVLFARMLVSDKVRQPMGLLHGGASLALAETMGSAGSVIMVDVQKYTVLGLQVSGNHVSSVSNGYVYGKAKLIHKGTKTHVWDVEISDEEKNLVSTVRVTNFIKEND